MSLVSLGLAAAAEEIRSGRLSALDYVEACLARIAEFEPETGAWSYLDPDFAQAEAAARDEHRRSGRQIGLLHGLPIGVKDIIDVQGMPCEFGSPLYAGRRPMHDAALVSKLRAAGAIIPGKTVTTEFATFSPGKPGTPITPPIRLVDHPAVLLQLWPPSCCRPPSAPRPRPRSCVPPPTAVFTAISQALG